MFENSPAVSFTLAILPFNHDTAPTLSGLLFENHELDLTEKMVKSASPTAALALGSIFRRVILPLVLLSG